MGKLLVKNLSLIYGTNRRQAMRMLEAGKTKEEILHKTRAVVAVNKASFHVSDGEIFVVMGLSGSGKSSLIRCLNMLNIPTAGEVFVDGIDITKLDKKALLEIRRQKISMVFQHFALLPHKTIVENVAFGLEIQNIPLIKRQQKAQEVLNMVGLSDYEDAYPHELSGGMQQRVGIARALANDSEILLMDEAFSALDPLIRTQMQDELIEIQRRLKKTIVFITHDLDEALKLGDTIAIMKDGIIVQQDTSENILLNPATEYVRSFIDSVDSTKVVTVSKIMKPFKDRLRLDKDGPANAVRQMKRLGHYFMPLVDANNKFQGYLRFKDAKELLKTGQENLREKLLKIPAIPKEASLTEALPYFAHHSYPLAVVDEKERPLGYLNYLSVIEMMSDSDDEAIDKAKHFGEDVIRKEIEALGA